MSHLSKHIQSLVGEEAALNMADNAAKHEAEPDATDGSSHRIKRPKTDPENGGGEHGEDSERNVLSDFQTSAVLSDSAREKTIFIHGKVTLGS